MGSCHQKLVYLRISQLIPHLDPHNKQRSQAATCRAVVIWILIYSRT